MRNELKEIQLGQHESKKDIVEIPKNPGDLELINTVNYKAWSNNLKKKKK